MRSPVARNAQGDMRGRIAVAAVLSAAVLAGGIMAGWQPTTLDRSPGWQAGPAKRPFEAAPDKGLEAAILMASPGYTQSAAKAAGPGSQARYVYARVDLNGDGREEVFAYVQGSSFCGTGGCTLFLFTPGAKSGYTLVTRFPVSRLPVIVMSGRNAGWQDVVRAESGGGAPASFVLHAFDGKQYIERQRLPASPPPAGTRYLDGELTPQSGILLEPQSDAAATANLPKAPAPSAAGFSTPCGVTVGGKEYRYTCTVEGAAPGAAGKTVLHFPDNMVTITWLGGGKGTATFAGMVPSDISLTTADGVTRFPFEDKVYFYVSDRTKAAEMLKTKR